MPGGGSGGSGRDQDVSREVIAEFVEGSLPDALVARAFGRVFKGDFIRTEIIEPAGLTVTAAAALRVSRPALPSLLNGKAGLSGGMALRIEKAFGVKMDTLMQMQAAYDIAQTRKRETEIRAEQTTLLKAAAFLQSNRDLFPDGSLPSQPGPDFATRPAAGLLALALSCDLTRPIVR